MIPVALLIEWERSEIHATRGCDGCQEGCESDYYDLHRDLDDAFLHRLFEDQIKTIGRMELAQLYFPYILPRSAWQKLKTLFEEDPALQHFASLKRRSFLPVEVNIIYQHLRHL